MKNWASILLIIAGLLGAAGVAGSAMAAHSGAANLQTGATFLMIHAAGIAALVAVALCTPARANWFLAAASLMALGVSLFSGDMATRAYLNARLFPMAAPIGGSLMIAAWLALTLAAIASLATKKA